MWYSRNKVVEILPLNCIGVLFISLDICVYIHLNNTFNHTQMATSVIRLGWPKFSVRTMAVSSWQRILTKSDTDIWLHTDTLCCPSLSVFDDLGMNFWCSQTSSSSRHLFYLTVIKYSDQKPTSAKLYNIYVQTTWSSNTVRCLYMVGLNKPRVALFEEVAKFSDWWNCFIQLPLSLFFSFLWFDGSGRQNKYVIKTVRQRCRIAGITHNDLQHLYEVKAISKAKTIVLDLIHTSGASIRAED